MILTCQGDGGRGGRLSYVCVCQHHTQVPPRVKETGNWSSKSDVQRVVYLSVEKKLRVGNLFPGAEGSNVEIVLHFPSPRLLAGCWWLAVERTLISQSSLTYHTVTNRQFGHLPA